MRSYGGNNRHSHGLSLIELLIVIAILASIVGIAAPLYSNYKYSGNIAIAINDILQVQQAIDNYRLTNGTYPASLAAIGIDNKQDPWGNAYQYTVIPVDTKGVGGIRRDNNLIPINSDYDLFSMGKNGSYSTNITAKSSHDDIIRANNGDYIGIATGF